jgi:hypothetical protein
MDPKPVDQLYIDRWSVGKSSHGVTLEEGVQLVDYTDDSLSKELIFSTPRVAQAHLSYSFGVNYC